MEVKNENEKKPRNGWQSSPQKKTLKRVILVISGIFLFFLIFSFFIVPALISSDKGLQIILSKINNSLTDGKAKISDLSVGWFKGVEIADFSYDDDAGWISVKVKNISTKPNYGSLLTGNFNLGQTQVDTPRVEIDLNKKPASAASTTSNTIETGQTTSAQKAAFALKTDLSLKDGNIKLIGNDSKTVELAQIYTDINIRPPGEQSNFNLGMVVAANNEKSPLEIKGQFKPEKKSGWSMKNADLDIGINIENLDLESIEPFLEMAGVEIKSKGSITVDIQSKVVNGQFENATGTIKGTNLEIINVRTKEIIKTSVLDVDVELTQNNQMINIDEMRLQTDWAKFQAGGAIPTSIKSLDSFLKADADYDLNGTFNLNVAAIVSQLPVTTGLKDNAQITSGNITGEIKTTGTAGQKQIQAMATLADLKGTVDGKQAALSEPVLAQAKVSPDKEGVNIDSLNVSSSFMKVNASGNLKQIKFDGQADLDKLQSELSQFVDIGPYKLSGQFNKSGQVSLSEQNVKLTGTTTIKGVNITGPNNVTASIPTGDMTYTLNLDKQKEILNINSLNAGFDFGSVTINNAVVPLKQDSPERYNVVVNAQQINLAKLQPFAVLFAGMPENIKISGIAESLVSLNSEKQIFTIKSDSTTLKDLNFALPDKKPIERTEADAIFDIELDAENKEIQKVFFRLNSPDINVPQANINQTSKNGVTTLNGDIKLQYDWAALIQIIGPFMPEGLELKGKRTNNINFVSEYPTGQNDKLLANMNAKADLGFQQAEYMGLNIGQTDIDIAVTNGVLDIPPFSTKANEGKLNFGAKADFKKQPALFIINKPTQVIENVKITDEMTNTLLKYLNPIFANATNVSGIANLHCDSLSIPLGSEHKNNAEIIATVSVTQLRLQASDILSQIINLLGGNITGTTLTINPTKFTLKDGFLRYDDMQVDIGNNPVNFSGVIGLDKSMNASVTLPYTFRGTTARVGQQNTDRIKLYITGTVDKPILDTSKILEDNLKNQLPNLIQRGLEELFN